MSLEDLIERLKPRLARHVAMRAQELRNEWVNVLSQPGTGHLYGTHRASAPGEAPAVDTGTLRSAVQVQEISALVWRVGLAGIPHPLSGTSVAVIGEELEWGSRANVAARPHARPAIQSFKSRFRT